MGSNKINISRCFGISDKGKVRENNEDRFWINKNGNFFAVVDGMGGHKAGEIASEKAVELFQSILTDQVIDTLKGNEDIAETVLKEVMVSINKEIYEIGQANPELNGMACTAVVVYLDGNTIHSCHLGDSRIYICKKRKITQLGYDHSYVAQRMSLGLISREEARLSPHRHRLTMALGMPGQVSPDYNRVYLRSGDRLLLCSDGLWDIVQDEKILDIVMSLNNAQSICKCLILEANNAGGMDNITVVVYIHTPDTIQTVPL
jgi:PPM family protein phosphatase